MSLGTDIALDDLEHDPDPLLARLRAQEPVCFVPALDLWLVTRWDDVDYIEQHPELFTAATEPSFLARALGQNLLTCDPPEHSRLHAMFQPPLQPGGRSGEFVSGELKRMANRLLDQLDPTGFELMSEYAQPLAAASLATVLGLDHHGFDQMWEWCEGLCADLANFANDPELAALGQRAKAELGAAVNERVSAARTDGTDNSAIGAFVQAGATEDEIINNVRLMISGGINEPRDGIGLVMLELLRQPHLRAAVVDQPAKLRRLIEEVFRVHSPVGTVTRQATTDVRLGDITIPQGALVAGVLRSINLDPDRWADPATIDLERREGAHAAFALGAHRCMGEWLGRQEVRVGVEQLLARFPDLMLLDDDVTVTGFEFRGPTAVHVGVPASSPAHIV